MRINGILLLFSLSFVLPSQAQNILESKLDGSEAGKSLSVVLLEMARKNNAQCFFKPEWIEVLYIQDNLAGKTLKEVLDQIFQGTALSYMTMHPSQLIILKDPSQEIYRKIVLQTAVRQRKKVFNYVFGKPDKSLKDKKISITGRVIDSKTREPLLGVHIQVNENEFVTTNEAGKYTLTLSQGANLLTFGIANHEDKLIDLLAYASGEINLELEDLPIMLDEVVILDQDPRDVTNVMTGQTQLSIRELKRNPAMLGEVDLIKQVQTLPGVTTAGEAASGFNVRGGSVDQNLILYDGMPIFNSSHVFGFFTAFNPEAVRDAAFYRGGIPAQFGGRASSVLDIKSKDGDYRKWNGNAGIGLITSNFMINGPIVKEKTAMAASFRSTYSNWLIQSVNSNYVDLSKSSVFFYDGTLKLTHLFSERTKLSVTGYTSKDGFRLVGDTTYQWSNFQTSAKVDHEFSSKLGAEFVAGVSSYVYSVTNSDYLTASKLSYQLTTSVAKAGFHYQKGKHKIDFGWQLQHYQFDPGIYGPGSPVSNAKPITIDKQYSIENAFYAGDAWSYDERLFVEAGLRLPQFISFGSATINSYKSGVPRDLTNVEDTLRFKNGELIKPYAGLEPRLSLRWMTDLNGSVKFGYNRMYQFLHLVTNTTAVTPVDIWQPSGYYFKPQVADQVSLGYFRDFKSKKYVASVETFYKNVDNIIDFKDGAQLILNKHLETDLLQGRGWSYGVETSVAKNFGRLTGSINYTFSRSFRQVRGLTASETINGGNPYPSNFDQPHIVNIAWKYNLSRRYYFTGNWTYHTGRPVTIPLSAFQYENISVAYYSGRNQYRIPDYVRLDIALVFEGNHKRKKRGESTWVLSVYNVLGRRNPYSIFFKSAGSGIPQAYQLSILGSALPSITYNFKF